MSGDVYLYVMVGVIALVTLVTVPSLFRRRCQQCGHKTSLDAKQCPACGAEFPEDE